MLGTSNLDTRINDLYDQIGVVVGDFSERITRYYHCHSREFKKRRRLQQRQRQIAVILLVKRTKVIVLHMWHVFSLPYSSKLLSDMTKFKVLTTAWTNYSESFSLTLYFKSVRTNPVLGHFAHIEQYKQDGIIMKYLE